MAQAGTLVLIQLDVHVCFSFLSWWHFVEVLVHSFVPPVLRLLAQHSASQACLSQALPHSLSYPHSKSDVKA